MIFGDHVFRLLHRQRRPLPCPPLLPWCQWAVTKGSGKVGGATALIGAIPLLFMYWHVMQDFICKKEKCSSANIIWKPTNR